MLFLPKNYSLLTKDDAGEQISVYMYTVVPNRPFARSGHVVGNKLHWDANYAVGLPKQRKVGLDWCEFLCFESPTA